MKTTILLIRHGQSVANTGKYFSGRMDVELTELGKRQALTADEALKKLHIDIVFSSPLKRAYETALPFAKRRGLSVMTDSELAEWNAGSWEGMDFTDIPKAYPTEYALWNGNISQLRMPNGESAYEVRQRFGNALDKIAEEYSGKVILIACHGGVIKTVPFYYADCDDDLFNSTPVSGNCSLTEISFENGIGRVVRYSDSSHLGPTKSEAFII